MPRRHEVFAERPQALSGRRRDSQSLTRRVHAQERNELDKFRLRLSQCVIFPPFKRQGHGARLLRAFYKMGREDASVLDMSVEDPSPEFQALRDLTGAAAQPLHPWLVTTHVASPPVTCTKPWRGMRESTNKLLEHWRWLSDASAWAANVARRQSTAGMKREGASVVLTS